MIIGLKFSTLWQRWDTCVTHFTSLKIQLFAKSTRNTVSVLNISIDRQTTMNPVFKKGFIKNVLYLNDFPKRARRKKIISGN